MSLSVAAFRDHTKIKYFHQRYEHTIELAIEKVAHHLETPAQYPLPSAGKKSLERALYDLVKAVPKKRQEKFIDHLKSTIPVTAAQRQQKYGDLATVDLKSNKPIAEQVRDLPVDDRYKISAEEAKNFQAPAFPVKKIVAGNRIPNIRQPRQAAVATQLDFIVDSLTCVKTNDIRKDEISLRAFATDAAGVDHEKAPFFVGKFKKGETVSLGANSTIFSFPLDNGSTGGIFPQTFIAGLVVIEADLIHNEDLGNKLAAVFTVLGTVILTISLGLMFVPGINPYIVLAGLIVAIGFEILGHYIIPIIIDDFSFPVVDTLVLDAPPAIGETLTRTLQLDIGRSALLGFTKGTYTANIRWVTR